MFISSYANKDLSIQKNRQYISKAGQISRLSVTKVGKLRDILLWPNKVHVSNYAIIIILNALHNNKSAFTI